MSDFVRVDLLDIYLSGDDTEKLGDGTLLGAIKTLTDLLSKVPQERHGSVQFLIETDSGYYDSGSSGSVKAWYERPKTTEELERERSTREAQARAAAARQEQQERAALAALRAKYGE